MILPAPRVLYESGPCLVVWKPPGVLTQAPPGIDSLELRIKQWLKQRDKAPGNIYLGVPHRLDRPVSGAMVFARHVRACRKLSEQFEDRMVRKVYWAVVGGMVEPAEGVWTDSMRKTPNEPRAEIVAAEHPDARRATLRYRRLGQTPRGCWLEIELETGRMHQIRLQAAVRGMSVLGDAQYGSCEPFGPAFDDVRLRAIALHGRRLEFRHPATGERVEIEAPLPEAWQSLGLPLADEAYLEV